VPPAFDDTRPDVAAAVIAEALEDGPGWLGFERLSRVLDAYGISLAPWRLAGDSREAEDAAAELGGAVALKAMGPEIVHKSELGAIRVGLSGRQRVADAAAGIDEGLRRAGVRRDRFLVQAMVEGGVEMIVGVVGDAVFGPVIACGAGGVEAELINDVSVRLSPLTEPDAREMLRSLATFPLLIGYRGAPKVDLESLEQLLLRTSAMVDAHHEIVELDLNPVIASPDGVQTVDARLRVEAVAPRRSWPRAWSP
jgi:acyl-CoA synthetase (NDP forming)